MVSTINFFHIIVFETKIVQLNAAVSLEKIWHRIDVTLSFGYYFTIHYTLNLQSFSQTLKAQVITFCDHTISKVNEETEKTKAELHANLDRNERDEIISTLEKNDELNRKHLQQRKTKKIKPKNQSPSEENEEIIHTEKRTNKHYKPSLTAVFKRKSNRNL